MDEYDGDALVRRSSRGWWLDEDGWWRRPIGPRDRRIIEHDISQRPAVKFATDSTIDGVLTGPLIWWTGNECNAWIGNGEVICRNAKQKRRLDNGLAV